MKKNCKLDCNAGGERFLKEGMGREKHPDPFEPILEVNPERISIYMKQHTIQIPTP